jgi:hypothetical protein
MLLTVLQLGSGPDQSAGADNLELGTWKQMGLGRILGRVTRVHSGERSDCNLITFDLKVKKIIKFLLFMNSKRIGLLEMKGIDPFASCLQSRRSTNMSYTPTRELLIQSLGFMSSHAQRGNDAQNFTS